MSVPLAEDTDYKFEDNQVEGVVREYLQYNQPDLIHIHCIQRLTGSLVKAIDELKIPFCVTVHDAWWISDHQFLIDDNGNPCNPKHIYVADFGKHADKLNRSIQRRQFLKKYLRKAEKVFAVSEAFTKIYRAGGLPGVIANTNGIDAFPRLSRNPSETGRVRVAHIGGISEHKGYHLFKTAVSKSTLKNIEVIVVDHKNELSSPYSGRWGNVDVTFIPKYGQNDINRLYANIDVLFAPSIWPESFGLVTREAAFAGVWVVASDRGAIGEDIIAGVNGDIVSVDDEKDLCRVLARIDSDPERYRKQLPEIRYRSVDDQVDELVKHYREILGRNCDVFV